MTKTTTDLYKQTPLGLIPNDWEVRKLEEIFEITAGGDIEKEFVRDEKDHEFQFPVFANAGKNKGLYGYSNKYKVDFECVTLSGRGEIGIANARFEKFYPIVRLLVLKPKQKMDIVFIENYLNKLNIHQESTGVPQLTAPQISKYKILLPPLPEQKAIAHVLSTADAAIQTTEKLIAQKEQRKKWLMQQLLTGKKRLKGFSGEWKEKKLGSIFSHLRDTNDGGDGHSIMTISAKLGLISQEDKFDRVIAGESLKKYTQLSKGDFAYNKGNSKTYPMGCIYRLEEKESALVPFVYICFRPSDKVDGMFYKQWFMAHGLDSQLNKIITSGARGDGLLNVNTDDFLKLKVPYPPQEEQTAIAQVLQAADKEINLLKTKATKLREQKKGLMQQLLTGKKRLNQNFRD